MSAADATALLDATRLFLARHEEALAAGEPTRGVEACDGLVEALGSTLPQELARLPRTRADDVVARRIAELEGLALQLKLAFHQLAAREVDVLRLVALLTATRRQVRALVGVLEWWAVEHGAAAPAEPSAADALRAAREALAAGLPDAAHAAIATAARRAGVDRSDARHDVLGAWQALDEVTAAIERKAMSR